MRKNRFGDVRSNRIDPAMLEVCHRDHLERYELAVPYAKGERILDVGCAVGYGAARLAEVAAEVQGIDLYAEGILYAQRRYAKENCHFQVADACATPFPDDSFDLVVSFEVIEHVDDPEAFVRSIRRMVKPGGIAILSTPNRLVSSPNGGVSDPTHLREYTPSEFEAVLRAGGFTNVALQGQHFGEGLGKMHALRAKMGRWDVLGLRRLLPGFFRVSTRSADTRRKTAIFR